MNCSCGLELVPKPVPGAVRFPRRLECPACGFKSERRSGLNEGSSGETPNDYPTEVASPADIFTDGEEIDSRY